MQENLMWKHNVSILNFSRMIPIINHLITKSFASNDTNFIMIFPPVYSIDHLSFSGIAYWGRRWRYLKGNLSPLFRGEDRYLWNRHDVGWCKHKVIEPLILVVYIHLINLDGYLPPTRESISYIEYKYSSFHNV